MATTRREFLVNGVRLTALAPLVPALGRLAPRAAARTLVVVQLTGGNDALNMVVPHRQDAYYQARPTLGLARTALHPLDDDHGLHPRMGELGRLFAEGRLRVQHGVGYPAPNRSHFRSLEIWHTGDPERPAGRVGWVGRMADVLSRSEPGTLTALHAGDEDLPLAMHSEDAFAPTVRDASGFRLQGPAETAAYRDRLLEGARGSLELAFLRDAARATYAATERMASVVGRHDGAGYPSHELGRKLQLVARLIKGNFGTRLFYLTLGGFDTHARQAEAHAALLGELSSGLGAFQRDLDGSGTADRVVTLVFSEFGRRVAENGSRGTDHGAAAPVLLLGAPVRAGLHGSAPDLGRLEQGDVPYACDLRSVYATLEADWMGVPASSRFEGLDLLG